MGRDPRDHSLFTGFSGPSSALPDHPRLLPRRPLLHGRPEKDLFLCAEQVLPGQHAHRLRDVHGVRDSHFISPGMARRAHESVRQEILPHSVRNDVYGSPVCGRDGLAAAPQSDGRDAQRVSEEPLSPVRPPLQHLHKGRPHLGSDHVLLPLRVHYHFPCFGKYGPYDGRSLPHFRRFSA